MSQQADVERMKAATIGQAYDMLYRRAATEKLRRETGLLGMPGEQWQISEPDEFGRIFRTDLVTGKREQVSGPTPAPPLTVEERERLKRIPTDIFRGTWFRNPETGDILPVEAGTKPPDGYTEIVPSREVQISDLPGKRFEFTKGRTVADYITKIRMNLKNEGVKGLVDFVNRNSEGNVGFVWMETAREFWPGKVKETVEVKLPLDKDGKQLTMADIRKVATDNGVAIEEVLRQIYELEK